MAEKLTAKTREILAQEIPPSEIMVRLDGKPTQKGRARVVAYVEWATCKRVLTEADPDWSMAGNMTAMGDPLEERTYQNKTKLVAPDTHFFAVRELTVCGITRSGTGENSSPKGAATDACKRASYQFEVAHQLMTDDWYKQLGLPGMRFYCAVKGDSYPRWPGDWQWETRVTLQDILDNANVFEPGTAGFATVKPQGKAPAKKSTSRTKLDVCKEAAAQAKKLGISKEDVTAYIEVTFDKHKSSELTRQESDTLLADLQSCDTHEAFAEMLKKAIAQKATGSEEEPAANAIS